MESPVTMGEAGDNVCKEKTKHADDGACVNGDINCDEQMEVCEIDSKAPEVNSNSIESLKNCEKVPANKVPIETVNDDDNDKDKYEDVDEDDDDDDEPMEIDAEDSNDKINCISDDDILGEDDEEVTEITEKSQENGTNDAAKDKDKDLEKEKEKKKEESAAVNGESSENSVNGTTTTTTIILDDSKSITKDSEHEQLNDSGDVVLIENDSSEHKENGDVCSSPDIEEIINISDKDASKENNDDVSIVSTSMSLSTSSSSATKKKPKKQTEVTPRRSSRNLNKQKSYTEDQPSPKQQQQQKPEDPESDIEEITPEDPLAVTVVREPPPQKEEKKKTNKSSITSSSSSSSTIVVSDTKRLVEIAANSKPTSTSGGKKEPTLVIIDTNSILSGRGPVPVSSSHKTNQMTASFSMVPVALPAQGVYPPNMRATITPIPMASSTPSKQSTTVASISAVTAAAIVPSLTAVNQASVTPAVPILPTLTDDMYVVEAPSFIVPYVYEKPPIKPFKEFVTQIHKELKELALQRAEKRKNKNKNKDANDEGDEDDDDEEDTEKTTKTSKGKSESDEDKSKKDSEDEDDDDDDDEDDDVIMSKVTKKKDDNIIKTIDLDDIPDEKPDIVKPKSTSYFDNALGQFFINIGYGLVQEYVQTDLLKQQKRKQKSEGTAPETKMAINSLIKNLEYSKENNEPYRMEQKRCDFCSFKTESELVLAHHLETPHMRNYVYKCNFCTTEVRSPHDILFHMEAEHNTRGRLERAPAFHQCPNCPFEDNQKGKLSRHMVTCLKKFKPESNLSPPVDWEPPAKIPRVPRMKQQGLQATAATYQALAQAKGNYQLFSKLQQQAAASSSAQSLPRARGRPSLMGKVSPIRPQTPIIRTNMMYRPGAAGGSVLVPTTYQFGGNQIFQVVGGGQSELGAGGRLSATSTPVALVPNLVSAQSTVTIQNSSGSKTSSGKVVQQPSISITPLPRQSAGSSTTITKTSGGGAPSVSVTSSGESSSSKATFVICEICDGYIKDLEQLRNHMQWIHKVKIHPKMIYNRPPLNCQKCQFRFFTDQGLERHLLGSHGLVTSSMQEAANKSKDAGRCPVCGRVYQWKLLNHVARDHNMTLKPAHLSYKCTVCTATFGMYKQFENHVYSAHSVVAKRVMDKKSSPSTTTTTSTSSSSSSGGGGTSGGATISTRGANDSLLKPLKINDEITIIPQPAKSSKNSSSGGGGTKISTANNDRGK